MLQVQLYTNSRANNLNAELVASLPEASIVTWVSPTRDDRFTEYRDKAFLDRLGLSEYAGRLVDFWPNGGPCWDALGIWANASGSGPIIVEAKSYPEEAFSSLSAKSQASKKTITRSLGQTSSWLGISSIPASWTTGRYQAANRLAHLYFLRELCGLDALLVFMCVVDDPTNQPTSRSLWETANEQLWLDIGLAGIPRHVSVVYVPGLRRPAML